MKLDDFEPKITSKTRDIMMVHVFGLTVEINPILDLAKNTT